MSDTFVDPYARSEVEALWRPREETPREIANRVIRMHADFVKIDPLLRDWFVWEGENWREQDWRVPLELYRPGDLARTVDRNVARNDLNTDVPEYGYELHLSCESFLYSVSVRAGSAVRDNGVTFSFAWEKSISEMPVSPAVVKSLFIAMASNWDATYAVVDRLDRVKYEDSTIPWQFQSGAPKFGTGRMVYLAAPLARLCTPSLGIRAERQPDGALLMIAADEPIDETNPDHNAAMEAIFQTMAPLNALPWPIHLHRL